MDERRAHGSSKMNSVSLHFVAVIICVTVGGGGSASGSGFILAGYIRFLHPETVILVNHLSRKTELGTTEPWRF